MSYRPDPRAALARRLVLLAVLALLGLGTAIVLGVDPWRGGMIAGAVGGIEGEDADGPTYTFRYAWGASYTTLASVSNAGPVPLTLIGLADADGGPFTAALGPLRPQGLYRAGLGNGEVAVERDRAVELEPFTVAPGEVYALWVDWALLLPCLGRPGIEPGASIETPATIRIRWSWLGVPRTTTIDIGYRVVVENPLDDPVTTCGTPG